MKARSGASAGSAHAPARTSRGRAGVPPPSGVSCKTGRISGELICGKSETALYKGLKKHITTKDNWIIVLDAHPPLVSITDFEAVERQMREDSAHREDRMEWSAEIRAGMVGLFDRKIFCADCGKRMYYKRQRIQRKDVVFRGVYDTCSSSKDKKMCSGHLIQEGELTNAVLLLLQQHIMLVVELESCLQAIKDAPMQSISLKKLHELLAKIDEEENHYRKLKVSLYQDFQEDVIPKEDFLDIRRQYDARITDALIARQQLQREIDMTLSGDKEICGWMQSFIDKRNLQELTRSVVVECIEEIAIFEDKRIQITFAHAQDYDLLTQHVNNFGKEVV